MPLTVRTAEQIAAEGAQAHKARCVAAIDAHVEAIARGLGYNGAAHLAGYVGSTLPEWAAEAQAFVAWRDAVWLAAYETLAGADPADPPPVEAVIAALPPFEET